MAAWGIFLNFCVLLFIESGAVSLKLSTLNGHVKCLPTAVERGPCHTCVCTEHGYYNCVSLPENKCADNIRNEMGSGRTLCTAGMRYVQGNLICTCTEKGEWMSVTCKKNFRYLRSIKYLRRGIGDILAHTNFTCTPEKHYLVECNLCLCPKTGRMTAESCTTRHCKSGSKSDPCKPGQFLRLPQEICSCSETGFYIDRLCVKIPNFRIQKVAEKDLAIITDTSSLRSGIHGNETCLPNQLYQADCNFCHCSEQGVFVCTSKICGLRTFEKTALRRADTVDASSVDLPELNTSEEKCEPGKRYRHKCNKCQCSLKGVPICTTMLCVGDFDFSKVANLKLDNNYTYF